MAAKAGTENRVDEEEGIAAGKGGQKRSRQGEKKLRDQCGKCRRGEGEGNDENAVVQKTHQKKKKIREAQQTTEEKGRGESFSIRKVWERKNGCS